MASDPTRARAALREALRVQIDRVLTDAHGVPEYEREAWAERFTKVALAALPDDSPTDHFHDPFDPLRHIEWLTTLGHKPLLDGRCEHRWRNRTTQAVNCAFLDGFRAGLTAPALAALPDDGREGLDVERLATAWANVMDGRRIGSGLNAARIGRNTTTVEDWQAIAAEHDRLATALRSALSGGSVDEEEPHA